MEIISLLVFGMPLKNGLVDSCMAEYIRYNDGFICPEDGLLETWPFDNSFCRDMHQTYSNLRSCGFAVNEANILARIKILQQRSMQHRTLMSSSLSEFVKTMMKEKDLCYYIDHYEQRLLKIYLQINNW